MRKCVVSVATGPHYVLGQDRLLASMGRHAPDVVGITWRDCLPPKSPTHRDIPYGFKPAALRTARNMQYEQILWADSSIVAVASLDPIWEHAARHGAWISRNGWWNSDWTPDSAYPDLFTQMPIEMARVVNRGIEHVVATAFALDLTHPVGAAIMTEYCRLGLETGAFRGPWNNSNRNPSGPLGPAPAADGWRTEACGPPDCIGGRHDQTALSVVAWSMGLELTRPPKYFAYATQGRAPEGAILCADGGHSIVI